MSSQAQHRNSTRKMHRRRLNYSFKFFGYSFKRFSTWETTSQLCPRRWSQPISLRLRLCGSSPLEIRACADACATTASILSASSSAGPPSSGSGTPTERAGPKTLARACAPGTAAPGGGRGLTSRARLTAAEPRGRWAAPRCRRPLHRARGS